MAIEAKLQGQWEFFPLYTFRSKNVISQCIRYFSFTRQHWSFVFFMKPIQPPASGDFHKVSLRIFVSQITDVHVAKYRFCRLHFANCRFSFRFVSHITVNQNKRCNKECSYDGNLHKGIFNLNVLKDAVQFRQFEYNFDQNRSVNSQWFMYIAAEVTLILFNS